jgi:hypothetical protein
MSSLYLIGDVAGFTPQIGRLVSMLNYVRSTTLSAVAGLSVAELDQTEPVPVTSARTIPAARYGCWTANQVNPMAATSSAALTATFEKGSGEADTAPRSASFPL